MSEIDNWLVHDHRRYDAALAECELAAEAGDWKAAIEGYRGFVHDLKLHMDMEDQVIYPLLERETGDPDGEIAELRAEHDDLERLLQDLAVVIRNRDIDHLLDSLVPLHRAMNEHNAFEEQVLGRLASERVLGQREEIVARLQSTAGHQGRQVLDF